MRIKLSIFFHHVHILCVCYLICRPKKKEKLLSLMFQSSHQQEARKSKGVRMSRNLKRDKCLFHYVLISTAGHAFIAKYFSFHLLVIVTQSYPLIPTITPNHFQQNKKKEEEKS